MEGGLVGDKGQDGDRVKEGDLSKVGGLDMKAGREGAGSVGKEERTVSFVKSGENKGVMAKKRKTHDFSSSEEEDVEEEESAQMKKLRDKKIVTGDELRGMETNVDEAIKLDMELTELLEKSRGKLEKKVVDKIKALPQKGKTLMQLFN